MKAPSLTILEGDCIEQLKTLPDESVHCCVTSPPYWGLRDYGTAKWEGGSAACDHKPEVKPRNERPRNGLTGGLEYMESKDPIFKDVCGKCGAHRVDNQIGLEKTPEEYVEKMVTVFQEVRRVLRGDGTCWVNLGSSYASQGGSFDPQDWDNKQSSNRGSAEQVRNPPNGFKPKDMVPIPWMVAMAMQQDGWWLRQDIIWHKPNPMPESVTDRCTKAHEYVFLLSKSASYFYDAEAIKEPISESTLLDPRGNENGQRRECGFPGKPSNGGTRLGEGGTRNKRSVWTIPSQAYSEAHFATFPEALVKPCILAGTSARGCCPKCGAPWERVVESTKTFESGSGRSGNAINGKQNLSASATNSTPDVRMGPTVHTKTTGWTPTCDCGCTDAFPCTVLDPFGGSFTTCQVALELGRNAVGIELNPEYVKLAHARCSVTPGLALA